MSKKPNIVFIVTDDQRFDTIHALGNNEISTAGSVRRIFTSTVRNSAMNYILFSITLFAV